MADAEQDVEMDEAHLLLSVEELRVSFADRSAQRGRRAEPVLAVDDVSFQVRRGETVGIVGESGSGKTTIARAILRLLEPSGGTVSFRGQDWLSLSGSRLRSARRYLQAVFQDPSTSLDPRLSVLDNVCEPLVVHRVFPTRRQAYEAGRVMLREVGIGETHETLRPRRLSGGQQQRVAIARALVARPEIIICDEPLSSLDVSVQAQVVTLLRRLQREFDVSYLFIGHDLGVVRYLCDRVLVMYAGRIVESATTGELFSRPLHPYTQLLVSVVPTVPSGADIRPLRVLEAADDQDVNAEVMSARSRVAGCAFHPRCPLATEICRSEVPQRRPTADGRSVACHHAEVSDPRPEPASNYQSFTKEVQR